MELVEKNVLERIASLLRLPDQLALLLTSKLLSSATQPAIDRRKKVTIAILRNWQIRVLPWSSSRTRCQIAEAVSQVCQQYDRRCGPFLAMALIVSHLAFCYLTTSPTRVEAMLIVRIRRALRRSYMSDLEIAVFSYGRLDYGLFWEYMQSLSNDWKSRLVLFMNDLYLPQIEYALSTYKVLPAQLKAGRLTDHEDVMFILCGNTL